MLTHTMTWTIVCFVLFGVFYSVIDGAQRSFVSELAPAEYRATALGLFYTAVGIMALPGGYILGTLRDKSSPASMFALSMGIGIIALIGLFFVHKKRAHQEMSEE